MPRSPLTLVKVVVFDIGVEEPAVSVPLGFADAFDRASCWSTYYTKRDSQRVITDTDVTYMTNRRRTDIKL